LNGCRSPGGKPINELGEGQSEYRTTLHARFGIRRKRFIRQRKYFRDESVAGAAANVDG